MKVLVIGGFGFFGSKIIESLKRLPATEIVIGGRSKNQNTFEIDLENKLDFSKLMDFDFVINTSTIPDQKYSDLIPYCLTNGVRFIETTSVFHTIERLLAIKTDINKMTDAGSAAGLFLFGAGIFPGVSNLVYKKHLEFCSANKSIDLNIRYKVLSGAGKGMCKLMVDSIVTPCSWFENFSVKPSKVPFNSLLKMPYIFGKSYSLQLSLPEILFINANTKIPDIKSFISFKPTFISIFSYYFFNLIPYTGIFKKPILNFLYLCFYVVRGRIFKKQATDICISCVTDNNNVSGIWFNDAFLSAGLFITAIVAYYENSDKDRGILSVEQVFSLDIMVTKMMEIGRKDLEYRYF